MKRIEVIEFFGNQSRTAKALGITRQAVCRWPDPIPLQAAARAEKVSGGKLKLDLQQYQPKRPPARWPSNEPADLDREANKKLARGGRAA